MDEDNTSGVGKRSRKQTAFFEVKAAPVKGTNVGEGAGIKLAENPHFCQELDGTKSDSAVCQALHWLLFGSKGKKAEVKKNLRGFSGFTTEVSKDDKKVKVKQNKSVWTVSVLKEALGLFGLEKSGDREVLVNRMVEFLAEPAFTKAARAPGSGKKRKSAGKAGKKGSKRAKKGTAKRKTAPSAYILYCKEQRAALKEEQPELSMIEQTKVLGAKWNALDEDAKKPWVEKAAHAKQALLSGAPGGATVDDIDFGSDDGSEGGSLGDGEEDGSDGEEGGESSDDGAEDDDFKALDEDEDE